jgi:hypothetical protein
MSPKFLREEASRFRGMAAETDREASKLRLLAMAADYESRATAADGLAIPLPLHEPAPAQAEPEDDEPIEPKVAKTGTLGLNETVAVQRRPVGRPRSRIIAPAKPSFGGS